MANGRSVYEDRKGAKKMRTHAYIHIHSRPLTDLWLCCPGKEGRPVARPALSPPLAELLVGQGTPEVAPNLVGGG